MISHDLLLFIAVFTVGVLLNTVLRTGELAIASRGRGTGWPFDKSSTVTICWRALTLAGIMNLFLVLRDSDVVRPVSGRFLWFLLGTGACLGVLLRILLLLLALLTPTANALFPKRESNSISPTFWDKLPYRSFYTLLVLWVLSVVGTIGWVIVVTAGTAISLLDKDMPSWLDAFGLLVGAVWLVTASRSLWHLREGFGDL